MKYLTFLPLLLLTLTFINCIYLRNLKLERDDAKYNILCTVANRTIYQLFNRTLDFKDRYDAYIQQTDRKTIKVVVDEYATYPNYLNQTSFTITDERAILPDLEVPKEASFDVYGAHDLQEEFKIFGNMVAAGYKGYDGNITIYRKETNFIAQARYICFVKKKNGELCGAFEIVQTDINDKKDIETKISSFLNKVKGIVGKIVPKIAVVSELISTLKGIYKDINDIIPGPSSSSSLVLSNLLLILSLLY